MFVGPVNSTRMHCSLLIWSTTAAEAKKKKKKEENADLKRKCHFSPIQTAPINLREGIKKMDDKLQASSL